MEPLTTESFNALIQKVNEFEISKSYFAHILYAQLGIFTLIVLILVGLYFFFNYKISKTQINKQVKKSSKDIEKRLSEEIDKRVSNKMDELNKELKEYKDEISNLKGQACRTQATLWMNEKNYYLAFIWWMRAGRQFADINRTTLTRIALDSARLSLEKMEPARLKTDDVGEYQELFNGIDNNAYKIEKELLDRTFKDLLDKKSKKDN